MTMGMRTVRVTVCDNCDKTKATRKWRISRDGSAAKTLDLCTECAAPLNRLLVADQHGGLFKPVSEYELERARARRLEVEGG